MSPDGAYDKLDSRYIIRAPDWQIFFFSRNAVDFGLPLLNNPRTAQLFVDSLAKKMPQGGLRKYAEGRIPSEVKSWREFIGVRG
jgi:hypothetical protein